jgi:hypothetical protein
LPDLLHRPSVRFAALVVALAVMLPVAALAMPVDPYAPYQPQSTCSPHAKPGTLRLSRWLQRTYPGSGSLGISRSCHDGGVSEHKEGRAFDWAVDVHSARDRGYVRDFLHRLFATDRHGDTDALARRMGIMYLIWNDHIYASYYGFRARRYRPCATLSACSDTLRHRNHVHISLSRAGGAGRTSWYTGSSTTPTPTPSPPPKPSPPKPSPPKPSPPEPSPPEPPAVPVLDLGARRYAAVAVPADGRRVATSFRLRAGTRYTITAAGLYGYGGPAQVADASCRWSGVSHRWSPYPSGLVQRAHGSLNLLVDGDRLVDSLCHRGHVYRRTLTPRRTGPLHLQVANTAAGADGTLRVLVSRPGRDVSPGLPAYPALRPAPALAPAREGTGLLAETVSVPAGGPVRTAGSLERGARYRVTVTGTVGLGTNLGAPVASDGRCVSVRGRWYRRVSLDRRTPDADHGRLYLDAVPFAGRPAQGPTCATHRHTLEWTAARTGRLQLAVYDPASTRDDSGSLAVEVQRLTPLPTPPPAPAERPARTARWRMPADTVRVRSASRTGAVSTMRLRAGQQVHLLARGTQRSGGVPADASCVRTPTGWHRRDARLALAQDPLDVWADGHRLTWHPVGGGSGCSHRHAYRARLVASRNGPVALTVLDLAHDDNAGVILVSLSRDRRPPRATTH